MQGQGAAASHHTVGKWWEGTGDGAHTLGSQQLFVGSRLSIPAVWYPQINHGSLCAGGGCARPFFAPRPTTQPPLLTPVRRGTRSLVSIFFVTGPSLARGASACLPPLPPSVSLGLTRSCVRFVVF